MLLFSAMWSLGAALELEDRAKLEEFVRSHESKLNWPKPEVRCEVTATCRSEESFIEISSNRFVDRNST